MCEFCGRHISSTTHPFGMFVGLICFSDLPRTGLTWLERPDMLLWSRTECHNIAKFDLFTVSWVLGRHISSAMHSFDAFVGLIRFSFLRNVVDTGTESNFA